jgi:hypothetical protein
VFDWRELERPSNSNPLKELSSLAVEIRDGCATEAREQIQGASLQATAGFDFVMDLDFFGFFSNFPAFWSISSS